jgi:predicted AAA+ superfamily ATPase
LESRGSGPVLLDEIHKDRRWKQRLKGLYDIQGADLPIIVTGSARLDFYRRGGDSLQGRYLPYRLHPFSVGETASPPTPENWFVASGGTSFPLQDILSLSGFPEPLLRGSQGHAARWSRLRLEKLVNEDIRDFRNVSDIQALKTLVELLPERVGGQLSINSLREDVGVAYATVRDWLAVLESLYVSFTIRPYTGNVKRSLRAEPKLYLYDHLSILSPGARLENACACHLLKACQYWTDLAMGEFSLHYFRTKEKEEIDFVVTRDKAPWLLLECKSGLSEPTAVLKKYREMFKPKFCFQLVNKPGFERHYAAHDLWVMDAERFLARLV